MPQHQGRNPIHKKAFDIIGGNLRVIWKAILQTAENKKVTILFQTPMLS